MLRIKFYPDSDLKNLKKATQRYRDIWSKERKKIVKKIEELTRLKFKEKFINAIVFLAKFPSQSYPLCLKAYESDEAKLATLIHELCHRVLAGNGVGLPKSLPEDRKDKPLQIHKFLDLILYDIWSELYGEKFAKRCVELESNLDRAGIYKKAWKWALGFSEEEREKRFAEYIKENKST